MKLYDSVELAVRNLRESVLRNSLTTIGISVGVASLVAMLSLGLGLQKLATRRLEKSGLFDTVVVTSRRDLRNFNRQQEDDGPSPADSPVLDEAARSRIEHLPDVIEAYPDLRFASELRFADKAHLSMILGLPFSAQGADAFDGMQGRFFASSTAPEAVLQRSFAEELVGKRSKAGEEPASLSALASALIGKQLSLRYVERTASGSASIGGSTSGSAAAYSVIRREQALTIVGICDLDPDSLRGQAKARVFVPLQLAESLHIMQASDLRDTTYTPGGSPSFTSVNVRVRTPTKTQSVEDAIKKLGFNTFSIIDATRSMRQFFAILDIFLGIFGSLALAVASIGIVNTLVMAILERRREIGIMKALGASDSDVKGLFFAEAGAMGIFGGLAGVALGWTIGQVINAGTNAYLRRLHFPPEQIWSVSWWLVLGAIGFAIVVSLLSGLYPASRAARLDPVQALRYE